MGNFSELKYWDERFGRVVQPFDWLEKPANILPRLHQIIAVIPQKDRVVLHIGSGSSTLSLDLRGSVQTPQLVHNVDFSYAGIEFGMKMERQAVEIGAGTMASHDEDQFMSWTQADLLNINGIRDLMDSSRIMGRYSIIVDKGTSDAIGCGQPIEIQTDTFQDEREVFNATGISGIYGSVLRLYPVWVLALHMAMLTPPGALWIVISHKNERFDFLNPGVSLRDLKGQDIPQYLSPASYWAIESKEVIANDTSSSLQAPNSNIYIGNRSAGHHLLVLRRSENALCLKD